MTKEIIISAVVGFALGIFVAPTIPVSWKGQMMDLDIMGFGKNQMMQIDAHFIEQMIPHHEDAITMAEIALEKAEHEKIKQLARDIRRTQTDEIEKMQGWYKEWYGREAITFIPNAFAHGHGMGLHMGMMGGDADIESLENAQIFDKEFIEQMIPHHQMAVMMAQMLSRATSRPEMSELAEDIISAQTGEINQMREWYRAWYGTRTQ